MAGSTDPSTRNFRRAARFRAHWMGETYNTAAQRIRAAWDDPAHEHDYVMVLDGPQNKHGRRCIICGAFRRLDALIKVTGPGADNGVDMIERRPDGTVTLIQVKTTAPGARVHRARPADLIGGMMVKASTDLLRKAFTPPTPIVQPIRLDLIEPISPGPDLTL